jgi:putative transposase
VKEGRGVKQVVLTEGQRGELERIARRAKAQQRDVTRAKIILAAADGKNDSHIAGRLGINREKSGIWRKRWLAAAEALTVAEAADEPKALAEAISRVLADKPRPGVAPTFTAEQLCTMIAVACEPPERSGRPVSHWTPKELAAEVIKRGIVSSISPRHVGRFLKQRPTPTPSEPLLAQQRPGGGSRNLRRTGAPVV